MAERGPAATGGGVATVTVFRPPTPPSLKPVSVADARSAPVGTGVAPVVLRSEIVMFGFAPLHVEQKRSTSIRFSCPVTVGVNVWPAQAVAENPNPVGETVEFCAAVLSGFES